MKSIDKKKKKLADHIIEEIKSMLEEGVVKEGEKLPNQNDFAEQLGVSRLSLREALHTLTLMGVVEQKPGRGTRILSGNPDMWGTRPTPPLIDNPKDTLDLIETRKVIEPQIASLAADRINRKRLSLLEKDIRRMEIAIRNNDIDNYKKHDASFHYHIAKSCNNKYLVHMYLTIQNLMEQFMREFFHIFPDRAKKSLIYHKRIFNSIKQGDRKRTADALLDHINHFLNDLLEYYNLK